MITADGFWTGSGSALLGSVLSGMLALSVFFLTRRHERRLLREELAYQAAEELAFALLDYEEALVTCTRNADTAPGEADCENLELATNKLGRVWIVRRIGIPSAVLQQAMVEQYNLIYDALYTYREMTSESSEEDVSVIFRDVIEYTEALTNVLLAWRSGEPPGLPAAVGVDWRAGIDRGPPRMTWSARRSRGHWPAGILRR